MAQKRFANQNVIVTGAGEGIGYAVARQFCAEGANGAPERYLAGTRAELPPKAFRC